MDIFNINSSDPPCPYRYSPPPSFRTEYEKVKYYEEEKRRWIEGYASLTGKHYFYLSQCKIKFGTSGELIRPFFRDVDMWIFESIDKAENIGFDLGVIKRREFGLTSIGAGCLPSYYMRVFPGSTTIMTSCDQPRIFRMFEDKTAAVYDNLHPDIQPKEERRNQTKDSVYLKTKIKVRVSETETEIRNSDVYCSETVRNPSAFSSVRCKYGFYDEFPLHGNREKLLSSSRACFMQGTQKKGFLLWGGTVEKEIPNETLMALRQIVADTKNSNTLIFFVEPWMGLLDHMSPNGWSNKEKGMEWVDREVTRLEKMESKEELLAFKKNYPKTIEDALEMNTTGIFPAEVVDKINTQDKRIIQTNPPVAQFKLETLQDGKIVANQNTLGKFTILQHPQEGYTYIAGIDPIPFNDAHIADGSDYCITIKCRETDTYVAYYAERNLNSDIVVKNSIMLQDYYKRAPAMLERNAGGVVLEKYKDFGRMELLADKPSSLGIKFTDNRITKGFFKNDKVSHRLNDLLIKYLLHHADTLWFKRQIKELNEYLIENTDLVDAMAACELYEANIVKKNAKAVVAPNYREVSYITRDASGKTVRIFEKRMNFS